jgi:hypothetical protein
MIGFKHALIALMFLGVSAHAAAADYVGIGVTIQSTNKSFQIVDLVPNGPAELAGVKITDWLIAVDHTTTNGLNLDQVVALLAGDVGTSHTLTLQDNKTKETRDVVVVRAIISVKCLVEGPVNLSFYGDSNNGSINGSIGSTAVFLNVFGGHASGNVGPINVYLDFNQVFGGNSTLSGWIRSTYINWNSSGNYFFGYQACIN